MIDRVYHVAGYVKLAKLWERSREQTLVYHNEYYRKKYDGNETMRLVGVYVDITGQKQISKRPEMLCLLRDCTFGTVDCIAVQTKAYLAANSREFCYLLKYLFDLPEKIEIVAEDDNYQIDTIGNKENQRDALRKMADDFVTLDVAAYEKWKMQIQKGIDLLR